MSTSRKILIIRHSYLLKDSSRSDRSRSLCNLSVALRVAGRFGIEWVNELETGQNAFICRVRLRR